MACFLQFQSLHVNKQHIIFWVVILQRLVVLKLALSHLYLQHSVSVSVSHSFLEAQVYADLFMKIKETGAEVFLVNTGWTGGAFGHGGNRFALGVTRQLINIILDDKVTQYIPASIPFFNFKIPAEIPGVSPEVLDPRTGVCQETFDKYALSLAEMFRDNFKRFNTTNDILLAGPNIASV